MFSKIAQYIFGLTVITFMAIQTFYIFQLKSEVTKIKTTADMQESYLHTINGRISILNDNTESLLEIDKQICENTVDESAGFFACD